MAGSEKPIRIATFNTGLSAKGPGLLLRDILKGKNPRIREIVRVIAEASPDAILLTNFDWDLENRALTALSMRLGDAGIAYPYLFALRPNTGLRSGVDLDGDGRTNGPGDAQGFGRFTGEGGMAILSRLPIRADLAEDHSAFLWKDLPFAEMPRKGGRPFPSPEAHAIQRLSSTGHWVVPVVLPEGRLLRLMAFHATPPVFDGPEDLNGLRNADEIRFWRHYLDGRIPGAGNAGASAPFVILGDANLDPADGPGRHEAIRALLSDPRLCDPAPASGESAALASRQGGANRAHEGDPRLDTGDLRDDPGPGNLRLDYLLPSADLAIRASGMIWPDAAVFQDRSRHALIWVDLGIGAGNGVNSAPGTSRDTCAFTGRKRTMIPQQ